MANRRRAMTKAVIRLLSAILFCRSLLAGEPPMAAPSATPQSRLKLYGWVESGITFNPDQPNDRQNFGRLFDDRANEPLFNQAVITLERPLSSTPADFDWGFKLQAMIGSDARFIHSLGLFDRTTDERVQPDVVEAYAVLRWVFSGAGSLDLKLGKFVTLEGAETIDPRTNFFYSHTYIFNFGIPLNHTGVVATWHATPQFDLYAGLTRGVNTSIEDNNDSLAFHGGVGLNLLEGKLTALATTHIGPETPDNNHDYRYLNDITITVKPTNNFTAITDLNYIYDEAADASGYGVAQYFLYTFSGLFSLGLRGEIWRDDNGFYVASFAQNDDAVDALRGGSVTFDPRTVGGGRTTYGALTLALNIKPPVPKPIESLVIRPELRFDRSLNGTHPFNNSGDRDQFTAGFDVIVGF
jgi:Putative beta-barrel porin-2, OmpL-like. bbp2